MKCPVCGSYETIGSGSTDNPIQQYCCINGHRFKVATCYALNRPSNFDIDHYEWHERWEPFKEN